jgi:penicillin-binding protein 1C
VTEQMTGQIRWGRWIGAAIAIALTLMILLTWPSPVASYDQVRREWKPSEAYLYDRNGALLDTARIDFQQRRLQWVTLDQINPVVLQKIVRAEDKRFYQHGGTDWLALGSAIRARVEGRPARGASTLSMQTAAFLAPQLAKPGARSWLGKIAQMRTAWALENHWQKQQILEAYVNMAPFRGEAQGIGAAALALFGKQPSALSGRDALLLAAILPNPSASADVVAKRACQLSKLTDCSDMTLAAQNMLSKQRRENLDPGLAPHLATNLLKSPGARVYTRIDAGAQHIAIMALRQQLTGLSANRVRDGAAVVIDNASGDVLAYVGGVKLNSTASSVDGAGALRQAGSTLKPFLYAQAIEHKWLTAASILDDGPVQLDTASGLYIPKNYDRSFKGPVSVRSALAGSLNVPAVRTMLLSGVQPFRDLLWDLGYQGITQDGDYYGFSLALGSAEVTLLQQANAFRALANGGRWSSARLTMDDPVIPQKLVISPQAAWIISDILSDASARAATFGVDSALRLPFWTAVKTGTSKAMRDNWCVGYSDRFTVAVWVGNLEGDSMKAVSGTSGAAPVWRDIMIALHNGAPGKLPKRPQGIEQQRISFAANVEPPRTEYFIVGTAQRQQTLAPETARRTRIANPVSGSVYAIDPDIPMDRQRMGVHVAGNAVDYFLILDKKPIGSAADNPQLLTGPGKHMLALVDASGRIVDQVRFTVR